MNAALVKNAEHDVYRDERGGDQQRLARQRREICLRRTHERAVDRRRQANVALCRFDRGDGVAERGAWREVERNGYSRKLAFVVDGQRVPRRLVMSERAERDVRA